MIEVKNLTKTYHNKSSKVVALSKLNFKLGDKGMVFLYGASGEGKSTVLNILCGLDKYDKGGKVLYNGKDIMSMEQSERDAYRAHICGLVFEKDNLISSLTVSENVKLARELNRQAVTEEEVKEVLKAVKLSGFEKRRLNELSSGELQRVAVARVLLCRPKILFVDEPTGHLDKNNSDIFWKTVKKLSSECLVVAITHKRKIVDDYADRVIELGGGSIISDTYINDELKKADEELFSSKVEKTIIETKYPSPKFKTKLKLGLNVLKTNKLLRE